MNELEVEFICQTTIRDQYKIDIPDQVYEIMREWSSGDSIRYIWSYDTRNGNVLISPEKPREEEVKMLKTTVDHQTENRTTVPDNVRDRLNLDINDNLYLWTHDDMGTTGASSVYVWTFDRISSILNDVIDSMSEDALYPTFP